MTQPTPYQTVFLKEFYRMYSRHHLSVKLSITLKELDEMLKHLGLRKKADAKRTTLTDEQKKFINDHFYKMTHKAISDQIR